MSELFGFRQIETREIPTLVRVFKADGSSTEEILNDLQLIDDLLVLQKSQSLLRRKRNLKAQFDARIGLEFGYAPPAEYLNTRLKPKKK